MSEWIKILLYMDPCNNNIPGVCQSARSKIQPFV